MDDHLVTPVDYKVVETQQAYMLFYGRPSTAACVSSPHASSAFIPSSPPTMPLVLGSIQHTPTLVPVAPMRQAIIIAGVGPVTTTTGDAIVRVSLRAHTTPTITAPSPQV